MPFTAEELVNIGNSVIEFHIRGKADPQTKQARPFYDDIMSRKKTFPGGKAVIDGPVKGAYSSRYTGFSHDDDVSYVNPANTKRWVYAWYELAAGISFTNTELKYAGIHVEDTLTGESTSQNSRSELITLTNLLEEKIDDLWEGSRRSFAEMLFRDGTQDAKAFPGLLALLPTTTATGVTGGLDRAAFSWWRHRCPAAVDVSTPGNLNLTNLLQKEIRQLRRYGMPEHKGYAGSDFLDGFEKEIRSKGNFTLDGWNKAGGIDAGMADISMKGINFVYDPLMDDLGLSKECFLPDLKALQWMPMENEEEKMHMPARPPEKFVFYRALTNTGAFVAKRLNTSGRYRIL
jgi:hypothetical protein